MRLPNDKYYELVEKQAEKNLLNALLKDIEGLNKVLERNGKRDKVYIDWQDYHDDYSPERTDPCPDYYGYYRLCFEGCLPNDFGVEMDIYELDRTICAVLEFAEIVFG